MPENRNQFLPLAMAFAAGVAVGANWPEIRKHLGPLLQLAGGRLDDIYSQMAEFLAERKERVEDRLAERRYKRKRTPNVSAAEEAFLAGLTQVARKKPRVRKPRARRPAPAEA